MRGKRNEPSHVVHTAKYLANFYNVDEDEFFALTTNNFFEIFKKAKGLLMNSKVMVTVLGCGSSGGVPRIDGDWGNCDPNEPKNLRSRCSLLVQKFNDLGDVTTVLIDTSPDLRNQLLKTNVKQIDAVLYTHDHADQSGGIDDLRIFALRKRKEFKFI